MSERTGKYDPHPQEPELLPCQVDIKELCDKILAYKPEDSPLTFYDIYPRVNGDEVQEQLRASSLGDLLLKDGESLSMPQPNERYPDLGLVVGDSALIGVGLRAWGWEMEKYRVDENDTSISANSISYFPGEQDWLRQLDILFFYSNGNHIAAQSVTTQTGSKGAGLPLVSRDISSSTYAETGYEGHNQVSRVAQSEDEIRFLVDLANELLEKADEPA